MKMILVDASELEQLIERSVMKALALNSEKTHEGTSDLMNVDEACKFLGIAKQTCYRKVSARELPYTKTGNKLIFSRSVLENFMRSKTVETADQIAESSLKNIKRKRK